MVIDIQDLLQLPLHTVNDAAAFFDSLNELRRLGRPVPTVRYIFFAKVDNGLCFEPYDLRAVSGNNRPNNYYVVTKEHVVFVNRVQSVYKRMSSLSEWLREASLFGIIRNLNFFSHYLKRKAILRWLSSFRHYKFQKRRTLVGKQLLLCHKRFSSTVLDVASNAFSMRWDTSKDTQPRCCMLEDARLVRSLCIYAEEQNGPDGYTVEQFLTGQHQYSKKLKKYMADALVHILSAVIQLSGKLENEVLNLPRLEGATGLIGCVNKEVAAKRQREVQREHKLAIFAYQNIGSLVRYAHHLQVQAIFIQARNTFSELATVLESKDVAKVSIWVFRVDCIVVRDTLTLSLSCDQVLQHARAVFSSTLAFLASTPTCASSTELQENGRSFQFVSLASVFAGDETINKSMDAAVEKVNRDYDEAVKRLSIYESFLVMRQFVIEWTGVYYTWSSILNSSESTFGQITEESVRTCLTRALKYLSDLKKISGRQVGTITITCQKTVASMEVELQEIVSQIETLLTRLTVSQYAILSEEVSVWLAKLDSPELSLESYSNWLEELRQSDAAFEGFASHVSDLQGLYHVAQELHEKLHPGDLFDEPDLNTTLRDQFLSSMSAAKAYNASNLAQMKVIAVEEHKRIVKDLKEMQSRLRASYGMLTANENTTAMRKLEKVDEALNCRRQEARRLDGYAAVLEMDALNWTEIGTTDDELKKYKDLWQTFEETEKLKARLQSVTVHDMNGQELKDTVISLFQRSFKLSKIIPGDVAEKLAAFLGAEKQMLPVYVELCNPALKEEHWTEIFRTTEVRHVPALSRTLTALGAAGLLSGHTEEINDVVSGAVGVFELEQKVAKIETFWAERSFGVAPYAGRPESHVIDGTDEILEELEEQQVVVQTCLASKFLPSVQATVETWEQKLSTIRAVIMEWISVQKAWMYLEFIFSSDDIKRQLPDESLLFSSADRFFSTLMKSCVADPHIAPLCLESETLKKLQRCTYQLDSIQKKLDEYLETKRVAFPRFYFLSNDELLSILSDSRNPLAVQPHLQKCFDNIKELVFKDTRTIVSMKSSEGEVVPFTKEVKVMGSVESWLNDVERAMRETLYDSLARSVAVYTHADRNTWCFSHPAQCVATADQIVWTDDVERVIEQAGEHGEAWPEYMVWYQDQLLSTVALVKRDLTGLERMVVSNLIVVDVHCRDVCGQLATTRCSSTVHFDWQKQLRYYWTEPFAGSAANDCVIRHGAAQLSYGYEYLGSQPRLVITPLTERAFLTCTAALHMQKGAAPQGPAGTGKTESVKDLGKALARQVVVFNCSDGLNYKMMSQMFAGLAQGGAWACFDEFNRIELEVLSVVAQQMLDITTAIANRQTTMLFEGHHIKLHSNFGVFITMNPGYAGRTELPDNLKALFRPICMMIPNYALIAEIMFYSEGYTNAGKLAKRMIHLYSLASQQLSKQDHYDFGMRAVKSILVLAGRLKRAEPDTDEELLLVKAIRDANLPKFLTDDTQLFMALVQDFFPEVTAVAEGAVNAVIGEASQRQLHKQKLQPTAGMLAKCEQLFDTLTTRHGLMLVGHTMTGKSTVLQTLAQVLTGLAEGKETNLRGLGARYLTYFTPTHTVSCNPKSITMTELYGDVNPLTREWQDGVFSFVVRQIVKAASSCASEDRHWVIFDGPVDAIWIENLNTVLDDSKMLCLVNGERIRIPESISLLFEVQDLRVASPATVSRCGMVYVDEQTLGDGWTPILQSLSQLAASELGVHWCHDRFMQLCQLLVQPLIDYIRASCKEYIRTVNAQLASQLFYLMKAMLLSVVTERTRLSKEAGATGAARPRRSTLTTVGTSRTMTDDELFDAAFVHSCVWGLGGNIADGYREGFALRAHQLIREANLPFSRDAEEAGRGVFDYSLDTALGMWRPWSELVPAFRYDASLSFFDLVVPTEHTIILNFLLRSATAVQHHVLLNGLTGTAKSSTVNNFLLTTLKTEDAASDYAAFSFTLSAQTSSNNLQETIESKLVKRKGDRELGPPIGKKVMVAVIDDCNVPQLEEYGAAPPIELLRQMVTQGGFYDRKRLHFKEVVHTMLIGCCGEPGGGKNELTPRFTSKMLTFCVPQLSHASMKSIYVTILRSFFEARSFSDEVCELADAVVDSTLEAYSRIAVECLPTPEKTHCTFNLRDVSKVIQGILQVKPTHCATVVQLISLWSHESSRVFHDRLVDDHDRDWWWRCTTETVQRHFHDKGTITEDVLRTVMYGNWGSHTNRDYQRIECGPALQDTVSQYLAEYNLQSATPMHLVLFTEAVQHLSRICRVINQPRGHALLVGVGGSGRTSLCRLAASMMNMDLQTVNIVRGYNMDNFREEMRKALLDAGARGTEVVFQLSDPQIVCSQMLEDVNNVLNIGEVPGMMKLEDIEVILRHCRTPCLSAGRPDTRSSIYQYFVGRCRERLHLVLCMSPMSGTFRERLRVFPALVSCTTIDWFMPWPGDALLAVAHAVLSVSNPGESGDARPSELLVYIHSTVKEASDLLFERHRRRNHTTPTSYLASLSLYQTMLQDLCDHNDANAKRYRVGLEKLDGANRTITVLRQQISDMQPALNAAAAQAEKQKQHVRHEQVEADVMREEQSKEEAAAKALMGEAEGIRLECEEGLQQAMPALEAAERALETLSAKDIQEIKTFTTPPGNVEKTMNAVLILLKEKEGWASAKSCLGKLDFITRLTDYPRDDISAAVIRKLNVFVNDAEFVPEVIEKTSLPCRSMCMWVHAMYKYYFVAKEVAPKRERLGEADAKVAAARANLLMKQEALQRVLDKIAALEVSAREAQDKADQLTAEIETARARLHRADQLTQGLASERVRWEESLKMLEAQRTRVVGTALLGAGCVAYLGPFPTSFREQLITIWQDKCRQLQLTFDDGFALEKMVSEAMVQQWSIHSLPRDTFSVQNATILHYSARWCYMIDPQGQANAFIRKKESGSGGHSLLVLKLTDENFMRSIENAMQVGRPVLLESVGETLDAALDPILLKQVRRTGGRNVVLLGDKEVTYNDSFKLYITTNLPNPQLTPELQVKLTVLDFTVTMDGLEEQLLADVVGSERAELQRSSDRCTISIAANREQIRALEEQVLLMLNEASGDVLDNTELISALHTSKATSEKIAQELAVAEATNETIVRTREKYRALATRGSLIYGVIADLARVDPMYEYSLSFFKRLVVSVLEQTRQAGPFFGQDGAPAADDSNAHRQSLSSAHASCAQDDNNDREPTDEDVYLRVEMLIEEVTWASYRVICRGLFERHKLLFSFLLAAAVMRSGGEIQENEWDLLLRGGVGRRLPLIFQDESRRPPYLNLVAWMDLGALCGLDAFDSLRKHFFTEERTWYTWFVDTYGESVLDHVPEPVQRLSLWHRMMFMKAVRPEKLHATAKALVKDQLGDRYTRVPGFSIGEAFQDSNKSTPIIFVLSPGTDPTALFCSFADELGFTDRKYMLSLGQDQGVRAEKMILDGRREGCWVYLQNCHVYASWMPQLQRLVESFNPAETHDDFRLWLTSSPSPAFPVTVLQAGMKLTREPPLGLKGKVRDTLNTAQVVEAWAGVPSATEDDGEGSGKDGEDNPNNTNGGQPELLGHTPRWKQLAFTLALFHGIIMERRQFGPLGWNMPYEWGGADFAAGLCTISTALSRCADDTSTPWVELFFMLGTIDYGGRVTDLWDTRCLEVITRQFFMPATGMRDNSGDGSPSVGYVPVLPDGCTYNELLRVVEEGVQDNVRPEGFGLHENASITVDRNRSAALVEALVSCSAGGGGGGAADTMSANGPVMLVAKDLLNRLPPLLPRCQAVAAVAVATTREAASQAPLNTLLSHEIDLYNRLIQVMGTELQELIKALKGEMVVTRAVEHMAQRLGFNQVPDSWRSSGYLSLKPLGSYYEDFLHRIAFIDQWRREGPPPSFWLPGLFFPQGFVTALLQARSRALHLPVDSLHFRFRVLSADEGARAMDTRTPDLVGAYVHGLYLEGCGWDRHAGGLVESSPGALTVEIPVLHFEPVPVDTPAHYDLVYDCPLYKTGTRAGTLSTTGVSTNFIVTLGLPSLHGVPGDHWTLRGVAALCSLDV